MVYKDSDPIAENKAWNAQADFASQVKWQSSISEALDEKEPFVQAGVYYGQGAFNTTGLSNKEQETNALKDVQSFCHHYYPQGGPTYNLSELVNHQSTVNGTAEFAPFIENARQLGKEFVFGETNSANQGGVEGLSDTYGAALWLIDYTMQAVKHGVKHLLFHHGTIGQCGYCWWQDSVKAPFYGAYMGALTFSKAFKIIQLDSGNDRHAAYALYDSQDKLLRILLLNTEFHSSGSQQQSVEVKLSGIGQRVRHLYATQLTADATDAVAGNGTISNAGQTFTGDECGLEGQESTEAVKVRNGKAMVTLKASEAVLLDLQA
ncbi:hypothetical protein KEM55_002048 [Ascosphaera atra]|nr:hypothetical protein KEM55_002048 [Ascosphaera atra]